MSFHKTIIIGTLIISLVFSVFSGMLFGMASIYNVPVDAEYQDMFNEYASIRKEFNTTQSIMDGGDVNPEGLDQTAFPNVIVASQQIRYSTKSMLTMMAKIPRFIAIPATVISIMFFILFVLTIFAFIKFISDREP